MFYHIKSKSRLEFLVLSIVKLTIHMLYNKYICYLADPNLPDTFSYQLIQFHTWIKFTYDSHEFIYALNSMKSNVSWLNSYKWIHKWNHGCVQDSGCYCRLLLWRTAGQGGCGGPLFASFQANYGLTGDEMLKICQACLSPMKETIETFNLRDYPRINVTTSRTLLRRSSKRARADSSNAMHKY